MSGTSPAVPKRNHPGRLFSSEKKSVLPFASSPRTPLPKPAIGTGLQNSLCTGICSPQSVPAAGSPSADTIPGARYLPCVFPESGYPVPVTVIHPVWPNQRWESRSEISEPVFHKYPFLSSISCASVLILIEQQFLCPRIPLFPQPEPPPDPGRSCCFST